MKFPTSYYHLFLIIISFSFLAMCSNNSDSKMDTLSDSEVYQLSQASNNWVFFGLSEDTLLSAESSGHIETRLRTKYNEAAQTQLNDQGIVRSGAVFPDQALIVKDLYEDDGSTGTVAVMYKKNGSDMADENGWVWGYFESDGTVIQSISTIGNGCQSCHASGIDFTMMNAGHAE